MKVRSLLHVSLFALSTAGVAGAALAADGKAHWDYEGKHGATHWGALEGGQTCGLGKKQSPIDIKDANAKPADLPALQFKYGSISPSIVNNGHTIQVNVPAGNSVQVGDQSYELLQFHFHTPSEERINGKQTAMVAHFVHKNAAGQLGVVGVLLQSGKGGSGFDRVLENLPARAGQTVTVQDLSLNLADLLPKERVYYAFEGSLTTPPCSEGVNWMVLKQPVTVSAAGLKAFRGLYKLNARPVQPLNGREVKVSSK
jgi:carbonic anhydrase